MNLKILSTVFALVIAIGLAAASCNSSALPAEQQAQATALAEWLTSQDVKMYGAYWCPHCADQKEIFGSAFSKVNYIECSLPNRGGQTAACQQAGITAYPTWEFADGTRVEDVLSLDELAERTNFQAGSGAPEATTS